MLLSTAAAACQESGGGAYGRACCFSHTTLLERYGSFGHGGRSISWPRPSRLGPAPMPSLPSLFFPFGLLPLVPAPDPVVIPAPSPAFRVEDPALSRAVAQRFLSLVILRIANSVLAFGRLTVSSLNRESPKNKNT